MNNDAIRDFAYAKVLMNMLEELASKYPLSQGIWLGYFCTGRV
jgi:hypothetical protein